MDREPELWTHDGRQLNLYEESQEPFQASAWKRKRELRVSAPIDNKHKVKRERFNKLDFTAVVIAQRLLTVSQVLSYAQEKGSDEMKCWVANRQRKLKEFIQDALEWETAK